MAFDPAEYNKRYRAAHPGLQAVKSRRKNLLNRVKAYEILGGACEQCRNSDPMVLEFNHRDGHGGEHRASVGGSMALTYWILNYPVEARNKIQLLCANCHAKEHSAFNGIEGLAEPIKGRR